MVSRKGTANRAQLAVSLVLVLAAAVLLSVVAFWLRDWRLNGDYQRFADISWWAGTAARLAGYLFLGKTGFKIALAVVLGVSSFAIWAHRSRRARADADRDRAASDPVTSERDDH